MRKYVTLFLFLALSTGWMSAQNTRFMDEIFPEVVKLENQLYSVNVSVVTGAPALDTLYFDLYMPAGDTCAARPLAVVLHTGTFIPRGFVSPTGDKDDYANIQVCERLAKRGYVAASVQYRVGWNPLAPSDTTRRSQIINAAYRSIQDMYAFIRFMNMTVENFGNPYSLDMDRVAIFGIGTGGFVGLNAAVLSQDEIYIDKFTNPSGTPMIDTLLVGDLHGLKPGFINVPNHVGFKDDFHFAFGLDGAVGDSSWMETGTSVPLVVGGTVTHPTTPFGIDPLTMEVNCDLPVTALGQYVVNIGGSACLETKANALGINTPLLKGDYSDPVSEKLRSYPQAFGQEHLWAINLPGPQTGPWEYWDSTFWDTRPHPGGGTIHSNAIVTNPDMGFEKANNYIDTALWFFSPRSFVALKLSEYICSCEGVTPNPDIVMLNDFECQRNLAVGAGNDRLMIMDNPIPGGLNESLKVGAYNDPPNDPWAAMCLVSEEDLDLSVFNQLALDVSGPAADVPFLLKLEGGSSAPAEIWVNTTAAGEWEQLRADFSGQSAASHKRVCIFPNGGVDSGDEAVYLLDNIRLEMKVIGLFNPTVEKLEVMPNPVSDMLYIRNPGDARIFRISNALGQVVMQGRTDQQTIVPMFIGSLNPAIYVVTAHSATGELLASTRILKN